MALRRYRANYFRGGGETRGNVDAGKMLRGERAAFLSNGERMDYSRVRSRTVLDTFLKMSHRDAASQTRERRRARRR